MKMPKASGSDGLSNEAPGERREGRISLAALRCFVAVVEGGGLSRAAEHLGLSQPTVSVTLAGLERACGMLLLHRRPRLLLTDAGRDMLVRARLVLGRMQELESSLSAFRGLRRGSLTIGFSTPFFAMPMIAAFLREHPGIALRTRLGNTAGLLEAVAGCEIEVAVMTLVDPVEGMACTKLADQRLVACMPRCAAPRSISLERVAAGPLVLREPGSMTRLMLERALASRQLAPQVRLEVGSREAAREAIAAGIGIGVVLDGELGEDTRLVAVPIEAPAISGGVYAVALPESLELPALAAFIEAGKGTGPGGAR
ncbi:LysR family transcriptional regulator [Roseomonas sp. BU-1]|uniref:LysR family transcriptional regulator n=2 Tax=Falsiroseomonas selenitidurans TaxID=2716335 RepID=A0ABX1E1R6_9PROT|nr:LysR family transcriptional regulator [Falsiroseomonas selenitidurans]